MLHPFPATRQRPIIVTLCAAVAAVAMLALAPGTARAECGSSTPTFLGPNQDGTGPDNEPGAPDIGRIEATVDADCRLHVDPKLVPPALGTNQYLIVYFDLDPSTGDPATEEPDMLVFVYPEGPWLWDIWPLPPFGDAGFTITLDELGLRDATTDVGIAVTSVYDPTPDTAFPIDETYDYFPALDQVMLRLTVRFQPPPPPPPPPTLAAPQAGPPATKQATGCVVPKLKGLTVRKAKKALKKAGCKYMLRGKGRVRSFTPKAGTRTDGTVQVKCKRKKRKRKRSRRSGISRQDVRPAALRSG